MSVLYPKAKEAFLGGSLNLAADTIKAVLVDTGSYSYSAAHQYRSSLSGLVGGAQTLTGKSVSNGVFDADDVTFTAVTGATVEAIVLYKDSGDPNSSPLIAYLDSATGLPVTPNGGDIAVAWDSGANRIFAL